MTTKRAGLLSKLTTTKLPGTKETVADMFVRRTGEGLGALVGIASASSDTRRAPERAGYIAASAINVVSSAFGWETPRRVSKTVLMPLLAANVWRRRHETSRFTTTTLLIGLAGGWLGDLILMPNKPNLNRGSVPFAVNQLAYHVLLWRAGARISALRAAIRFPLWAGSVPLVGAVKPEALPAAVGYGPLLAVTSTLADDPALLKGAGAVGTDEQTGLPIADAAYGLGHGGNLFLISDTLLMARKMFAEEGVVGKLLNAAVMDTYTVAQLFLVEGLLALDRA
ncbi:lysoplasmalogenase [Corynebacterium amycolatum]|uniref:lysoplasmalogenase n=1 Tax=Corynebacterium amycolatum TaxID=43765 RepID=UPI000185C172|nr:lysoplasmalogenase [Corynebacterium amycolatum]EEB63660.1 YhhN-like protein [Corynebacterium amycolatum SK46]